MKLREIKFGEIVRCKTLQEAIYLNKNRNILSLEDLVIPETPVEKSYIKCILNDGTVLDFDKLCNEISTLDKNFVKFMLTNPKTHDYTTLGAIPIANIKMIDFVKSKDDIDAVLGIAVKEG